MKKILFAIMLLSVLSPSLWAQSEREKINEIKKTLDFIYAESSSMVSAEDATENAKALLELEIEQWLKEQGDSVSAGYVAKAKNKVEEIKTKKGKLTRSFVYAKKTDILSYNREETIMMVGKDNEPHTAATEVESPQQPTSPILSSVPQRDVPAYRPTEVEREMLEVKNLTEINSYIVQGRNSGRITNYGRYDSETKLVSKSYLYLINKEGTVVAVLSKKGNTFTDVRSGANVAISDYGRCGVIWFQIKYEESPVDFR